MKKFSEEELNKIKNTVAKAEKTTSGEIVPFVTEIADSYPGGTLSFCLVLICLSVAIYLLIKPWPSVGFVLLLELFALVLGLVLTSIFPVLKVIQPALAAFRVEEV